MSFAIGIRLRILLIQPPYDLQPDDARQAIPPLGLAYIAAVLEREGYDVRIVDCVVEDFHNLHPLPDGRRRHGLPLDGLSKIVEQYDPALVGVSCLFSSQARVSHEVCALIKQITPDVVTVMGGAHPSATPRDTLDDPNIDVVVIGEGELSMLRIARAVECRAFPPSQAAGLAFRDRGNVVVNATAAKIENLDQLPLPARHMLPMKKYFAYRSPHGGVVQRHPCTNMITSRGCPAKCCFCSIHNVWGRRFRCHSAARVVEEIETLMSEYGVREIQFEDDNLTLHKRRMQDICRLIIDRGLDITWSTPNGVAAYALDERLLALMRAAGCRNITLGIESGSQHTLKEIIGKPLRLEKVKPIVRACRKLGLGVSAFFVIGFPGETKDAIRQTIDFACELDVDTLNFFTATPYPGTRLYDQCIEQGLIRTPVDYGSLRIGRPLISTSDWNAAELVEMAREAQARFYRSAARRHPVRFFSTVVSKFVREPLYITRKARDVIFPRVQLTRRRGADRVRIK